jgi:hypothetical protein
MAGLDVGGCRELGLAHQGTTCLRSTRGSRPGGEMRAAVAVAHSMLVSAYYMLERDEPYRDLGTDWFDKRHSDAHTRRLVAQLPPQGRVRVGSCGVAHPAGVGGFRRRPGQRRRQHSPAISADGRCVAFVSDASNLVAGDTNRIYDVCADPVVTPVTPYTAIPRRYGSCFVSCLASRLGMPTPRQWNAQIVLDVIAQPKTLSNFAADLSGIELRADDIDWSFGSGTPGFGAAQDLALVLGGRKLPTRRLRGFLSTRFIDD